MKGAEKSRHGLFSYISPEHQISVNYPSQPIRNMVDKSHRQMHIEFTGQYSKTGRPLIRTEQLLQVFYAINSERLLNPEITTDFFNSIRDQLQQKKLMFDTCYCHYEFLNPYHSNMEKTA